MSSVLAGSTNLSKKIYLTTAAYNNNIYELVDIGTLLTGQIYQLQLIPGLTSQKCPKGSLLRENGKKIYPGQHLNINGTTNNQYMVSVFDDQTFTRGFINPAAQIFTPMNSDQPSYIADLRNSINDTQYDPSFDVDNLGAPVFTWGDILANGNMDISGNQMLYGNLSTIGIISGYSSITARTYLASGVVTVNLSGINAYVDSTKGNTFIINLSTGTLANTGTLFLYFGASTTPLIVPPSGSIVTVIFPGLATGSYYNVALANYAVAAGAYTSVRNANLIVYANTTSVLTFISDGTVLREISRGSGEVKPSLTASPSGGLQIIASGSQAGTNTTSITVATPYATDITKIFLTDQNVNQLIRVTSISVGTSFTVSCPTNTTGTFNWMIIA